MRQHRCLLRARKVQQLLVCRRPVPVVRGTLHKGCVRVVEHYMRERLTRYRLAGKGLVELIVLSLPPLVSTASVGNHWRCCHLATPHGYRSQQGAARQRPLVLPA